MLSTTLAIGVLLGLGFICAKAARMIRLPSVTGYIIAGLALGPSGFRLITQQTVGANLDYFTELALMLVAFGIGEHLEWNKLKPALKSVTLISIFESGLAFLLVGAGVFTIASISGSGQTGWAGSDYLVLALLLGAISIATAPAATMMVMRESKAAGPVSDTLMAVVAANNGLAITFFGMALSAARQLAGATGGSHTIAVLASVFEILGSLVLGVITGLIIDLVIHKLRRRGDMLTFGLALLLLLDAVAGMTGLSPLLAGMAAGCAIVNRNRRDVRLFRTLNDFEPPFYILFFTLAGAHLDIDSLAVAGWLCLAYFVLRMAGKATGSYIGARLGGAPETVRRWLGLALMPQAGIAIGLVFLIQSDSSLSNYARLITPVVLGSVFLAEVIGPAAARYAFAKAGETPASLEPSPPTRHDQAETTEAGGYKLVPWSWGRLAPLTKYRGTIMFVLTDLASSAGLARMAAIIAHGMQAKPLALRLQHDGPQAKTLGVLSTASEQIRSMGSEMLSEISDEGELPFAVAHAAKEYNSLFVLAAHPPGNSQRDFHRTLDELVEKAPCPVISVRFRGVMHTERILVPVASRAELRAVGAVVWALSKVGMHRITLMTMLPCVAIEEELEDAEGDLLEWARDEGLGHSLRALAVGTDNRVQAIVEELAEHDLLVMPVIHQSGLQRFFTGSLAHDVVQRANKPMLLVHEGRGANPMSMPL